VTSAPTPAATPTPAPAHASVPAPVATESPDAIAPDAIAPDAATSTNAEASPPPTKRTAFKLAKQLRNFQGCTHEQHREADQSHQEHHRRRDVHSKCSLLQQISDILRGNHQDTLLSDLLGSGK
jgi:hypothetical protein